MTQTRKNLATLLIALALVIIGLRTDSIMAHPGSGIAVDRRLGDDSPIIDDVYVNGNRIKAVIDTGGGGIYFALMPEAISSLGLEQEMYEAEPNSSGVGVNGVITSRKGKIKTLRIAAINIDSPTVIFYPKGVGKDRRKYGGAIGNALLQDFVVTFDYLNKTVVLERP